ncbi:hypothetical protein [Pontibacter virosus]|uniref:PH (Pleckstrin Homology) domain-containing protein n=1 Tax=Pontibacter virosus TaxID=1765052 RepID=A0A2U1AV04_9BACT|nr:hypothetical protein [Pontibacter virosus]PVY40269.1 hypothetical protein C8E01_108163 [Pontibacter virosus]
MKRDKKYKLKLSFPYEAIMALLFFSFMVLVCLWQYSIKGEVEYLVIGSGGFIILCFFGWLFNENYKSLVIGGEALTVKYWLWFNSITIKKQDVKGYKIKETYTRHGLDYHIILVPLKGKEITFIRDSYANYERLEFYFKKVGVHYIGTENINSPYKHVLAMITIWGTAISAMLFFLLQLFKLGK